MRPRRRGTPPQSFSKTDRRRLYGLGVALLLVVVAIQVAADPATWAWIFPGRAGRGEPTLADVSFAPKLDGDDLAPDEFRSEPADDATPASSGREPAGTPTVDPSLLAAVEDDTLTLRAAERRASFDVLAKLRGLDAAAVAAAADGGVTFPVVMTEPGHFRGKPIAIEGRARRIVEIPAGSNDAGFERLYDLWVFTPESGNNPWHVLATAVPDGLPRSEWIAEGVPVRVAGVFFKREGYASQGGLHVAPLLLAKTVEPGPMPAVGPGPESVDFAPWLLGGLLAGTGALALLLWRLRAGDRRFEAATLSRLGPTPPEQAPRPPVPTVTPEEFLRRLEEAPEADASS